jgi:hypothetical protein
MLKSHVLTEIPIRPLVSDVSAVRCWTETR